MERFTNDHNELIQQVKLELLTIEKQENWTRWFSFLEMPFFLHYAYSISLFVHAQNQSLKMLMKEWNTHYDFSRFKLGFYNLDRLAILEKEISLNEEDKSFFHNLQLPTLNTVPRKAIVLDNLICELHIPESESCLEWNVDSEMNENLLSLVTTLRIKHQFIFP